MRRQRSWSVDIWGLAFVRDGFGRESSQALGYREVVAHVNEAITRAEALTLVKRATRRFARRQMTWLRRMEEATWIHARESDDYDTLADRIIEQYQASL